jgi:hypothetical protein
MIRVLAVLILLTGAVVLVLPDLAAGTIRRLNRGSPGEHYWWYDPVEVRRSRLLRIGYRLAGLALALVGLSAVGALPVDALLHGDVQGVVERIFFVAAVALFLGHGIRFLYNPAWWEQMATKGKIVEDGAFRIRMVMARILGVLLIVVSGYVAWSKLLPRH